VGTIQAQIFGHHDRGDTAKLRGEMIGYRFPAAVTQGYEQTHAGIAYPDTLLLSGLCAAVSVGEATVHSQLR
jgi:hypothetical protein